MIHSSSRISIYPTSKSLPQESYDKCKKVVIRAISTHLESLFKVQEAKTEEMENTSYIYGLLLSACGLTTMKMRNHHSYYIKTKVSHVIPVPGFRWSQILVPGRFCASNLVELQILDFETVQHCDGTTASLKMAWVKNLYENWWKTIPSRDGFWYFPTARLQKLCFQDSQN